MVFYIFLAIVLATIFIAFIYIEFKRYNMRVNHLRAQQERTMASLKEYEQNNDSAVIDVHKEQYHKHKKALLDRELMDQDS